MNVNMRKYVRLVFIKTRLFDEVLLYSNRKGAVAK